jgi:hypothetical protein
MNEGNDRTRLRRVVLVAAAMALLIGGTAVAQTTSAAVVACINASGLLRTSTDGTCTDREDTVRLVSQDELDQVTARVAQLENTAGDGGGSEPAGSGYTHILLHRQPSGLGTGPCITGAARELPERGWSEWTGPTHCRDDAEVGAVALHQAMFNRGAEATVRYVMREHDNFGQPAAQDMQVCAELFNVDLQVPVPGSEACATSAVAGGDVAMPTASFELPDGAERERLTWRFRAEYEVQVVDQGEWIEHRVVPAGSIAEVVVEVLG